MSEASTPKTWWEAFSSHIVWGSLVFTCFLVFVEKLIEQHYGQALAALLLGLGIAAVALHSKTWLERTNPNWMFAGTAIAVMALVSFPFVEQRRWPFTGLHSPGIVPGPPSAEDIAKATAPIRAELESVKRELTTTRGELENTKQQLRAARNAPTGRVLTPEPTPAKQGPITWHVDSQLLVVSGGAPNAVVNGMLVQGTSTASVTIKEAYVVSGLTGRKQELMANVQSRGAYYPVDKVDIPPDAPVQLDMIFNPALSIRDFLDQWGKFRVTIVYNDGVTYERDFDEAYIRQKLRQQVPNAFGPRVTPKDDK
jgi:hypothetical protein